MFKRFESKPKARSKRQALHGVKTPQAFPDHFRLLKEMVEAGVNGVGRFGLSNHLSSPVSSCDPSGSLASPAPSPLLSGGAKTSLTSWMRGFRSAGFGFHALGACLVRIILVFTQILLSSSEQPLQSSTCTGGLCCPFPAIYC